MRRVLPLLLLLTLLSACAGAPDQPSGTPQPATAAAGQGDTTVEPAATPGTDDGSSPNGGQVVISHAAWEGERTLYEPLAKKFMDENPNIKIVIVPMDDLMNNPDPSGQDSPLGALRRIVSGADAAPAFFI